VLCGGGGGGEYNFYERGEQRPYLAAICSRAGGLKGKLAQGDTSSYDTSAREQTLAFSQVQLRPGGPRESAARWAPL